MFVSSLHQSWKEGEWVNSSLLTYSYNGNGFSYSYLQQLWEEGEWVNWTSGTGTYDENDNPVFFLYQLAQHGPYFPFPFTSSLVWN